MSAETDKATLRCEVCDERGWGRLLVLQGQIDFYTSPDMRKELLQLTGNGEVRVAVDLTGVEYVDSSGVATFVEALQKLSRGGGEFALVGLRDPVRSVFEIARLENVFSIHETREALFADNGD